MDNYLLFTTMFAVKSLTIVGQHGTTDCTGATECCGGGCCGGGMVGMVSMVGVAVVGMEMSGNIGPVIY